MLAGATVCPHCNGVANVVPHPRLKQVCGLCGAPRVEPVGQPALSGNEREPLARARTAERQRIQWKIGGWFGGITSGFILLLWLLWALIFGVGVAWAATGLALAAPFLAVAIAGIARSKAKDGEVERALGEAYRSAARDLILAQPNGITTRELAAMLPLSEDEVEQLAAELSVESLVSSRVTEDGQLLLQAASGASPAPGPRIDVGAVDPHADPLEERFAELEAQQAEEDAQTKKRLER